MQDQRDIGPPLEAIEPGAWRWYHGALFYVVVQGLTAALGGLVSLGRERRGGMPWAGRPDQKSYFRSLKQAAFAPPSWAFAPAWTINNLSVIWGTLRVLNMPPETEGRKEYLALQAATWVEFVVFTAAYFGLRSPLNALVLTAMYLALTVASGLVAVFKLKDSKVALSLATLFVWLLIATPTAACQALWNRDALYKVGPFARPPRGWSR
jgi:tryptophan-rich sensory protein